MARVEHVTSRMSTDEKVRVEAASVLTGRSRSAFVRDAAVREARSVINATRNESRTGRDPDEGASS